MSAKKTERRSKLALLETMADKISIEMEKNVTVFTVRSLSESTSSIIGYKSVTDVLALAQYCQQTFPEVHTETSPSGKTMYRFTLRKTAE